MLRFSRRLWALAEVGTRTVQLAAHVALGSRDFFAETDHGQPKLELDSPSVSRVWHRTENWCSLCKEPFNSWNEHRGKRDHICLELFYDAVVDYHRQWQPALVWNTCCGHRGRLVPESDLRGLTGLGGLGLDSLNRSGRSSSDAGKTRPKKVQESLHVSLNRRRRADLRPRPIGATAKDRQVSLPADPENPDAPPNIWKDLTFESLFLLHDRGERQRREEIAYLIRYLADQKFLFLGTKQLRQSPFSHLSIGMPGSLVQFKWYHPAIMQLFPRADAKQVSGITQMIASTYNSETVFDLCGMTPLVPPEDRKGKDGTTVEEVTYFHKGVFLRSLLGQLRWTVDSTSAVPFKDPPPHLTILGKHLCKALVAETIFCRLCEYVVRVEAVWRENGQEMGKRTSLLAPQLPREGCRELIHHQYFDEGLLPDFSKLSNLPPDPTTSTNTNALPPYLQMLLTKCKAYP